jgi:microcystin degradation protein MlrC
MSRSRLRFVIARVNHETNTFSPLPTPLATFEPRWGFDALAAGKGSATAMGAFLDFAKEMDAEIGTPVFAHANPSGPVHDAAFEALSAAILASVEKGCDAVLLDLHGAMVCEGFADGEGELLARIRAAAPDVPIGVALDLHGNVTQRMVENCDVLIGFKTYPHVDMAETGAHVARLIGAMLKGGAKPHMAWRHPPMLAHTLAMNTTKPGVMRDMIDAAIEAEAQPGILGVTIFGGFPIADTPDAGMCVVAVAESAALADSVADALAATMWERRAEFVYHEAPLAMSLDEAQKLAAGPGIGPVLLLDHGDNCMSGATCDTMGLIEAVLARGFEGVVAGPICDPQAVALMTKAGVGAKLTLGLGNGVKLTGIGIDAAPVTLTGTVKALGDGSYVISGPTYTGMRCEMGRVAVLDLGTALILVSEKPHEPWDLAVFTSIRIDPLAARYLLLKSRMYCRPVFEPIARGVVECASPGVTSSDYRYFRFEKLKRPIHPLDMA